MNALGEWNRLAALTPDGLTSGSTAEEVAADQVPEPYRSLLDHRSHMTARMERFHGTPVDVVLLLRSRAEDIYRRAIVLVRRDNRRPVQMALAEYDLSAMSAEVRDDILAERIPLGRILIERMVECTFEIVGFLRVTVADGLAATLDATEGAITYGRVARISCDGKAAFLVAEVSRPLP